MVLEEATDLVMTEKVLGSGDTPRQQLWAPVAAVILRVRGPQLEGSSS